MQLPLRTAVIGGMSAAAPKVVNNAAIPVITVVLPIVQTVLSFSVSLPVSHTLSCRENAATPVISIVLPPA